MAINPSRNLPSFSEMYSAFKNKGSLGDAISAGVKGYETGEEMGRKRAAQESQSELERAQAAKALADSKSPKDSFIRIDQILDPKEKADLAQYATPNAEGVLVVPQSTYSAVTKRGLGQETLDIKTQLATMQAAKDAEIAALNQEKLALQQQLGPANQQGSAARSLAEAASNIDAPTIPNRAFSFVKEAVTGKPTSAVLAERQGETARKRLQELQSNAQGDVTDKALGITPVSTDPLHVRAEDILRKNGKPITPANIEEVKRRLRG